MKTGVGRKEKAAEFGPGRHSPAPPHPHPFHGHFPNFSIWARKERVLLSKKLIPSYFMESFPLFSVPPAPQLNGPIMSGKYVCANKLFFFGWTKLWIAT